MILDRPEAGLREVARATGLSAATVRDVRQRIVRGEDPVPDRYRLSVRPGGASDVPAPPPAADGARVRRPATCADQATLLEKLRLDPSLRFNETGRGTLRWLHQHSVDAEVLDRVGRVVPDHCAPVVARLARCCATEWTRLAEQLERRTT
jgi:hypothetical protein